MYDGILNSINCRNKLYKVLKQTKTDAIRYATKKSNFNRYRNILSKTIAFAKQTYYIHIFDQCKRDMKKTWATLSDKTSRSRGHGRISSELLKLITGDISKCITLIINQSLHSGIFPDNLKIAKVTPIHKKGDIKLVTNFGANLCSSCDL